MSSWFSFCEEVEDNGRGASMIDDKITLYFLRKKVDLDGDFFLLRGWIGGSCTFFWWDWLGIWQDLGFGSTTDSIDRVSRCRCIRATAIPFLSRFMIAWIKASQLSYVPCTFLHMCLPRLIVFVNLSHEEMWVGAPPNVDTVLAWGSGLSVPFAKVGGIEIRARAVPVLLQIFLCYPPSKHVCLSYKPKEWEVGLPSLLL
jgi:hypothetical protein